jgi:hypothetical protein
MNMCNNISLPCPRLARWAFGVQVFTEEQFVLHLTACTHSSHYVWKSLYLCAHRSSFRSHSLTPLGQPMARRCSPWVRIQATVRCKSFSGYSYCVCAPSWRAKHKDDMKKDPHNFLPPEYFDAHNLCFFDHDIMVQTLVSGERQDIFKYRFEFENKQE